MQSDQCRRQTGTDPEHHLRLTLATVFTFFLLVMLGCRGEATPEGAADGQTIPTSISLVERWKTAEIEEAVPPQRTERGFEVRFGDAADREVRHGALAGVTGLEVVGGRLRFGVLPGPSVIRIDLDAPIGTDDKLWSIEATLAAEGPRRIAFLPLPPNPPAEEILVGNPTATWSIATPLIPGSETREYSIELEKTMTLGVPMAKNQFSSFAVRVFGPGSGSVEIESIRFVFRSDHLDSLPSGPGWYELGGVYRESLLSRASEPIGFTVFLPSHPWLDVAVGSIDQPATRFRVTVTDASMTVVAGEIAVDDAGVWKTKRVDLSPWADREVLLRLESESTTDDGRRDRGLSLWGAPTIRNSLDPEEVSFPTTVILFLSDTLRRDHLEAWGHRRLTAPHLSRLAEDGVLFEDAIAQATWTKSSIPSILTSLYPSTTGVTDLPHRIHAAETTLAEIFREAGYATFATASIPFAGHLTNLHQGVEVMFDNEAHPSKENRLHVKSSGVWVDAYLEWLASRHDVPTFATLHVMDPHSPFQPPAPYDTLFSTEEDAQAFAQQAEILRPHIADLNYRRFLMPNRNELKAAGIDADAFVDQELAWYDASIRHMDHHFGRMLARLEELGLSDSALVAFVSDHGEEFLEHGRQWHGLTVYGEVANVPMLLWGRGVPEGVRVEQTVQTLDLLPTLADLAGLEIPPRAQGRSLVPLFAAGSAPRALPAFTERHLQSFSAPDEHPSFSIVDDGWKLIWNVDAPQGVPTYELYDHREDPLNQEDVAGEHPEVVERLSETLERWKAWAESQRLDESEATSQMSAEELEQLRSLGYID